MNITIKATGLELTDDVRAVVESKLGVLEKLLAENAETAFLEVEIATAPAEGRSAEPFRMDATLAAGGHVYRAEEVKPSVETVTDRVRDDLAAELRKEKGRERSLLKRGAGRVKRWLGR